MSGIVKLSKLIVLLTLGLLVVPTCMLTTVPMGSIGVRSSNMSGVLLADLKPGWHLDIPGIHRFTMLPSSYQLLNYTSDENKSLLIRTQDNNNVTIDVTVPYRIIPDEAHLLMEEGAHLPTGDGGFRFQRLASNTAVSVLREELAQLQTAEFYDTARRLEVADQTLKMLNEKLKLIHLEAESVLIRAVAFRPEYEAQLQAIQLNEQNKLLDGARKSVAEKQQTLDNYTLETNALAAARAQEWIGIEAELERSYQVGFLDLGGEAATPGKARQMLTEMSEEDRQALRENAKKVLDIENLDKITDAYLLGIKNIEAETLAYKTKVLAEADGISARQKAEGDAQLAAVRGEFESKLNALLDSPAGRAYVAYKSAQNITFDSNLTFQSDDGIPSVLRLRDFAAEFMGTK